MNLDPSLEWPPIHPAQWALDRKYNDQDLAESTQRFQQERNISLQWLASLEALNLDAAKERESFTLKLGDLAASWLAHDQLAHSPNNEA